MLIGGRGISLFLSLSHSLPLSFLPLPSSSSSPLATTVDANLVTVSTYIALQTYGEIKIVMTNSFQFEKLNNSIPKVKTAKLVST